MKNAIFIIAFSLIFTSCNNSADKADAEVATEQPDNATETDEYKHSPSESIELDNGSKWKVVPEMMKHIRNMESDVHRFNETQHSDLKDFTQLGRNLQKSIDLLTSSCSKMG